MIDIIIISLFAFATGYAIGRGNPPPRPEEPQDFSYYKNLSESLLSDVRRLREELRSINDKR